MSLISSKYKINRDEWVVGLSLLIALFLPHVSTITRMVNPILALYLFFRFHKRRPYFPSLRMCQVSFIVIVILSLLLNVSNMVNPFKAMTSSINLCLMMALFPLFSNVRVRNLFIFIALGYMLLSQLCYVFHISPAILFFEKLYPFSEDDISKYEYMLDNVEYGASMFGFRFGGLYHNSNHMAKYLCMVFALYLVENKDTKTRHKFLISLLALLIVLLTGSRTGLITFVFLLFFSILSNERVSPVQKLVLLTSSIAVALFILSFNIDFRGLKVSEGIKDSAGSKFSTLLYYLDNNADIKSLLLGNFDSSTFISSSSLLAKFDAEYGYIIYNYGLLGFFVYGLFWITVFKTIPKGRKFSIFLLFWIVSSTVLLAYRSTFVAMLVFSRFITPSFSSSSHKQL